MLIETIYNYVKRETLNHEVLRLYGGGGEIIKNQNLILTKETNNDIQIARDELSCNENQA